MSVEVAYLITVRTFSKQHVETLSGGRQCTQPLYAKHLHYWQLFDTKYACKTVME